MSATSTLPLLTGDLPGIGGVLKSSPEDFLVEEVLLYQPCGKGEHVYAMIEKVGITTQDLVQRSARILGISPRAIGYAGLKDKEARSRQTLSFLGIQEDALSKLPQELPVTVISVARHANKLRIGHLTGNRFVIKVRGVRPGAVASIESIVKILSERGVPNYFGEQRFGIGGDNPEKARAFLTGSQRLSRFQEKFLVSSLQSELFNKVLAARVLSGTWDRLLMGEVARKASNRGLFNVEDLAIEEPRCRAFDIHPTGPLHGPKMMAPRDEAARVESDALGNDPAIAWLSSPPRHVEIHGDRRSLRVLPAEFRHDLSGSDATFSFMLPKGSYATVVMQEIMKG